jgi:hypothetical protein
VGVEAVVEAVAAVEVATEAVMAGISAEAISEEVIARVEGTHHQDQALVTCPASVNLLLGLVSISLVSVELSVNQLLFLVLVERGRGSVPVLASVDPGLGSPLGRESRPGRGLRLGQELRKPPQTTIQLRVTITPHTSSSTQVTVTITAPARSLSAKRFITKTVARVSTTITSNSLLQRVRRIAGISGRQGGRSVT